MRYFDQKVAFAGGIVFGTIFASLFSKFITQSEITALFANNHDSIKVSCNSSSSSTTHLPVNGSYSIPIDDRVAQDLVKRVRIVCWIMTYPKNHHIAMHIKRTWGTRCNKLLFFSTQNDTKLETIALENVKEGRRWLWAKERAAFEYIYEFHLEDGDWFLQVEDDTYVIMENLRYLLSWYNAESPLYFGCRFKNKNIEEFGNDGYMSGGAGNVLSKEALIRFVEKSLPNRKHCNVKHRGSGKDVEIARCLQNSGVQFVDTTDELGRYRFLPFTYYDHLHPGLENATTRFPEYNYYYPHEKGLNCCSDSAITFHKIKSIHMYALEYLVYHLRPYGISHFYYLQNTFATFGKTETTTTSTSTFAAVTTVPQEIYSEEETEIDKTNSESWLAENNIGTSDPGVLDLLAHLMHSFSPSKPTVTTVSPEPELELETTSESESDV